jgi:hypothetical protein
MKVFLTFPPLKGVFPWEGRPFVDRVRELFEGSADQRGHSLAISPEEADVILYLEPNNWRDRPYAELLLREENIRRFPEKCFVYNYTDFFIGFLPGVYTSLTRDHENDPRFASWSYLLGLPNPFVHHARPESAGRQPSLLFSFRGSDSASVRGVILQQASAWSGFARITQLRGRQFYNVPADLQRVYVEEALDSQFILCPRGLGCTSHRLFETMALGRVPVILSDQWVAPAGPAWAEFSLRIAERDVSRLPEILQSRACDAAEMGTKAKLAWETWFAPTVVVPRLFDRLAEVVKRQPPARPDYARLWRSARFYSPYGLAPHQRFWKNLRNGRLWGKLWQRLLRTGQRLRSEQGGR